MTVIVYRDGIMASDSECSAGGIRVGTHKKVAKTRDGMLVGGAGRSSSITTVLNWHLDENEDKPHLGIVDTPECNFITVDKDGKVLHYDGDHKTGMTVDAPFCAIGAGSEVALGAMEMGATAQEAVKAAIKYVHGCGGKIQVVKL